MANRTELLGSPQFTRNQYLILAGSIAGTALIWLASLVFFSGTGILTWMLGRFFVQFVPIVVIILLCILPGLALLRWFWGSDPLPWPERLSVAMGVGIGLPALLLIVFHLLGLSWGFWQTIGYFGIALFACIVPTSVISRLLRRPQQANQPVLPRGKHDPWQIMILVGLCVSGLISRLYPIRDQLVGANVDSYHHTLISQLLVDRGGLFQDWLPYVPLKTFTYHYGFHAIVAFSHWLTGMPIMGLLPLVGQVIAAAMIPAIYTLTVRFSHNHAAGIAAALLIGFFNTQPAYYAFWGRYPFIASHVLLIAVICCWQHVLAAARLKPGLVVLTAITSAALAHTHYQTTIFAALFLSSMFIADWLHTTTWRATSRLAGRIAVIGALTLLLALPWLLNTFAGELDRNVAVNSASQSGAAFAGVPLPPWVPLYLKAPMLVLAVAGLVLALRRKEYSILIMVPWALLSQLIAYPYLFGLPGTGAIEPTLAAMVLYLSIGPLAGYAVGIVWQMALEQAAKQRYPIVPAMRVVALATVILITAWGTSWQSNLVPPYIRMVTAADLRAMAWVRENTPADARFLVNSNPLYAGAMVVGTDAGWWLPYLAGRATSVPPLSYGSEVASDPMFVLQVHRLAEALRSAPLADGRPRAIDVARAGAIRQLRANGIRYVYLGAQALIGPGTFPDVDRIDPGTLRASSNFRIVYDADGVLIFELLEQ
jgi:hypothetical protein